MSTRSARRPWGTFVLWVIAGLGFVYLFTPLVTIALFSFNDQGKGRFNTEWHSFTWHNWAHAFQSGPYLDALRESVKVAAVACVLATVLGAMVALAITRYKMKGGAFINLMLVVPLTTQHRRGAEALRVPIPARDRLLRDSYAMAEQPRSLDRTRLSEGPLTSLTEAEMAALEQALRWAMGLG